MSRKAQKQLKSDTIKQTELLGVVAYTPNICLLPLPTFTDRKLAILKAAVANEALDGDAMDENDMDSFCVDLIKNKLVSDLPEKAKVKQIVIGICNRPDPKSKNQHRRQREHYPLKNGWHGTGAMGDEYEPIILTTHKNRVTTKLLEDKLISQAKMAGWPVGNENAGGGGVLGLKTKNSEGDTVYVCNPHGYNVYCVFKLHSE